MLGFSVTVAVSVTEPPKVMVEDETVVDIVVAMTSRVSFASPQGVEMVLPFLGVAGL